MTSPNVSRVGFCSRLRRAAIVIRLACWRSFRQAMWLLSMTLMLNTSERPISGGNRQPWHRSTAARLLIAATLALSLLLGGAVALIDRFHSSPADFLDHPDHPVSDDQSEAQVVEPAKQIIAIAQLQKPTADYLFMSCKDHDGPPYQGAIYMNFAVPKARADVYFREIRTALVAHGWHQGIPPNRYAFGATLYRDDVTAIVYQDGNYPDVGVVRLYGQCRNMNDHRSDTTAWTDITDRLGRASR